MQISLLQFCPALCNDHLLFFLCLLIAYSIFHQGVTCSGLCWSTAAATSKALQQWEMLDCVASGSACHLDRVRMLRFCQNSGRSLFQNILLFLVLAYKAMRCMSGWYSRKKCKSSPCSLKGKHSLVIRKQGKLMQNQKISSHPPCWCGLVFPWPISAL